MGKQRKIKSGDCFYSLEVVKLLGLRPFYGKNASYYLCKCLKCGNTIEVPGKYLGKVIKDCGCGKREPRNRIPDGTIFGRLKVIEIGELIPERGYEYLCECQCEKKTRLYVRGDSLRNGETQSCGCIHDELFRENTKKAYEKMFVENTSLPKISYPDRMQRNNTSGVRGVYWHKHMCKWYATIGFQKKPYFLGYYDNIEDAAKARKAAEKELFGNFLEWYAENYKKQGSGNNLRKGKKGEGIQKYKNWRYIL